MDSFYNIQLTPGHGVVNTYCTMNAVTAIARLFSCSSNSIWLHLACNCTISANNRHSNLIYCNVQALRLHLQDEMKKKLIVFEKSFMRIEVEQLPTTKQLFDAGNVSNSIVKFNCKSSIRTSHFLLTLANVLFSLRAKQREERWGEWGYRCRQMLTKKIVSLFLAPCLSNPWARLPMEWHVREMTKKLLID